jgi:hypothetical protein
MYLDTFFDTFGGISRQKKAPIKGLRVVLFS